MSASEEILGHVPIDQLAAALGTDEATAKKAALAAIPVLIGGMESNARDDQGAVSLVSALNQHNGSSLLAQGSLQQVDPVDGDKIVNHVLTDQQQPVVRTLGGGLGLDDATTQKLLKLLAPIVMAWLAKKLLGGNGGLLGGAQDQPASQQAGGGVLADILESLLPNEVKTKQNRGGLGGLLDSLLGR